MNPNYAKAIQMYESGLGTIQISRTLKLHRSIIQRILKKSNVILRRASPRSNYNIKFFSDHNENSCYWAGFILADGCIRKNVLHIKLSKKDKSHLEKFLKSIESNYTIKDYENDYSGASCVSISGNWYKSDLFNNFGITERKTFEVKYPNIPEKYDKHFIRGIFDGDGCITKTTCPSINFVGTIELLLKLSEKFYQIGVKLKSGNKTPPIQISSKNIGSIHYSGKNAKKILDWIYGDSDESNRLERKFLKYKDLF